MSPSPLDRMIDRAVRCVKCRKPGVLTCECWITLRCPVCGGHGRTVERDLTIDPPAARVLVYPCSFHETPDSEVAYYDADGEPVPL